MRRPPAWSAASSLALVLAAGVALRAARLDRPLWIDEAVTWAAAELPVAQILELRHRERHPPLYYVLQHFLRLAEPDSEAGLRALFPALHIAAAAALVLPGLVWLLQRLAGDPGAARGDRPDVADLLRFAGLSSAGLIGARSQFLSAEDLAPSALQAVPELAWSAVGMALLAVPLVVGARRAFRRDGRWRRLLALSVVIGLGTVLVPFAAGLLFRGYAWALKTLLGPSVMVLVWAGIGLAGLRPPVRATLLAAYTLIAAGSLVPFYTKWVKTPLGAALQDLARSPETDRIVLIERAPRAPLAFYYLGSQAEILAPMPGPGAWTVARITPGGPWGWLAEPEIVSCESLARHGDRPIHLVARRHRVRAEIDRWPESLRNRRLLEFRRDRWRPLLLP